MPLSNAFRILNQPIWPLRITKLRWQLQHPGPNPTAERHLTHICLFPFTFVVTYIHSLYGALNPQLKVKVSPSYATQAQRAVWGTAVLLLNVGAGSEWSKPVPQPLYSRERSPAPTVQQAGWNPGPVWKGVKKRSIFRTGFRTPNRPARSKSLHPLRYGPWTPNERVQ